MNGDRTCNLRVAASLAIGIGNLLLAALLALACIVPFVSYLLLILYTVGDHPVVALLALAIWIWAFCSAIIFIRVAILSFSEKRWNPFLQSLPFVVGAALSLLTYVVGGWKIIVQTLGWN